MVFDVLKGASRPTASAPHIRIGLARNFAADDDVVRVFEAGVRIVGKPGDDAAVLQLGS